MMCALPNSWIWPGSRRQRRDPFAARCRLVAVTEQRIKSTGFNRLFLAFGNSFKGMLGAFREEAAFRQELGLAILVTPGALWLGRNGLERALLIAPMLLILIVELLNSAIEATVDRIGGERHHLSGLAKDIGSAAVFFSFILLATVWALVLLDR